MLKITPHLALIALVAGALAPGAHAAGINHFNAAAGPHNYIVTNHPAVLPNLTPSAWLLGTYAHKPLVCRDADGNEAYPIVEHQGTGELAAALGLFDRFELGASMPATYIGGPATPTNTNVLCGGFDEQGVSTFGVADPRLFGKVLLTPWNEGLVASLRVEADLPLAQLNQDAGTLAGEKTFPNFKPALSAGYSSPWFRAGVDVGMIFREPAPLGDSLVIGQEITYGAGTELTVVPSLLYLNLDVYGKASPAFLLASRDQFPLEGIAALKAFVGPVVITGGAGTGLIADYGSPDLRVFAGVGWYPRPEPEEPEPEPEPEPGDRDGDGILDPDDECPDAPEDFDGFEDEDGCPDVDNDEDGILDRDDECPDNPEDRDRWEDSDGCPDPDNDQDEILDADDECPNDPEVYNDFEDEDGCPDSRPEDEKKVVVVVKRDRVEIKEKVFFAFDSDRILPKSYQLLDDVARVITEHTEIPKIRVEGHTSSEGSDKYNLALSRRRAASVMRYLVAAGVDPDRLESEGFGEAQPIDTNETEDGRSRNRRVEFKIVDEEGDVSDEEASFESESESESEAPRTQGDADPYWEKDDADADDGEDEMPAGDEDLEWDDDE
jgi:outer membrane protein OmpA-like peptidoglycan-associated protein